MSRTLTEGEKNMLAKIKDRLAFLAMVGALLLLLGGLIFLMSLTLGGCGDYTYDYGTDDYYGRSSGESCEGICASHCGNCWSWSSDILKCEVRCETLCRSRGCSYIDIPSNQCDEAFQRVCTEEGLR